MPEPDGEELRTTSTGAGVRGAGDNSGAKPRRQGNGMVREGRAEEEFAERKRRTMAALAPDSGMDRSRKGSLDVPIAALCEDINRHPGMYTTSSCSGRISVFGEPTAETRAQKKKGGAWVFVSHDRVDPAALQAQVTAGLAAGGRLILRFEPFILHCECASLPLAHDLLQCARAAGFKESALMSTEGRIMVCVRCSIRLETPVADSGRFLIDEGYLLYLVRCCNEKFELNEARHLRFRQLFCQQLLGRACPGASGAAQEAQGDEG